MTHNKLLSMVSACVLLAACETNGQGSGPAFGIPNEVIVPAALSTADAMNTLADTMPSIEESRKQVRIRYFKGQVTRWLNDIDSRDEIFSDEFGRRMLCDAYYEAAAHLGAKTILKSLASQIQAGSAPYDATKKNMLELFKDSFFSDVAVLNVAAPSDAANKEVENLIATCRGETLTYVLTEMPYSEKDESIVAIIGLLVAIIEATKTVYDTVKEVAEPIAKEAATEIIQARRAEAIRKSFADETTVNALKQAIEGVEAALALEDTVARNRLMTAYITAWRDFQAEYFEGADTSTAKLTDACSDYTPEGEELTQLSDIFGYAETPSVAEIEEAISNDPRLTVDFASCYGKAITKGSQKLNTLLVAAAAYDTALDQRKDHTAKALRKSLDELVKLSKGELTPAQMQQVVKANLAILARTFEIAAQAKREFDSEENKKNVEESVKGIIDNVKAIEELLKKI